MSARGRPGLGCMARIVADISLSVDGFVTGPDPGPDNGLGTGGEALHTWAFSDDPEDRRILADATERSGAVVLGRRLFDLVDGPQGWDDRTGYGAREVGRLRVGHLGEQGKRVLEPGVGTRGQDRLDHPRRQVTSNSA